MSYRWSVGRFNGALHFDGALSNTVVITDATNPARYAIELWVRPAVVTDTSFILRTGPTSGTAFLPGVYSHLLGISGDHFLHLVSDSNGTHAITSTTPVTPGTWYHVVGLAQSNGEINPVRQRRGTSSTGRPRHAVGRRESVSPRLVLWPLRQRDAIL